MRILELLLCFFIVLATIISWDDILHMRTLLAIYSVCLIVLIIITSIYYKKCGAIVNLDDRFVEVDE